MNAPKHRTQNTKHKAKQSKAKQSKAKQSKATMGTCKSAPLPRETHTERLPANAAEFVHYMDRIVREQRQRGQQHTHEQILQQRMHQRIRSEIQQQVQEQVQEHLVQELQLRAGNNNTALDETKPTSKTHTKEEMTAQICIFEAHDPSTTDTEKLQYLNYKRRLAAVGVNVHDFADVHKAREHAHADPEMRRRLDEAAQLTDEDMSAFEDDSEGETVDRECSVCLESMEEQLVAKLPCRHVICLQCYAKCQHDPKLRHCPLCRKRVCRTRVPPEFIEHVREVSLSVK